MKRKFQDLASLDLYKNREKVKWAIFIFSFVIGLGSIYYTNTLVEELKIREKRQVDLYAEALEYASVNSDNLTFVFQVIIQENKSIPVITVNSSGEPMEYKNINIPTNSSEEEVKIYLLEELESMKELYEPISLSDDVFIYYRNSDLLTRLQYYPYVQLSVILVFGLLAYAFFNQSKVAEQNRLWAGLTKETAHQLGTPLASLMAWIDYLKNSPVYDENKEVILEIEKDINKLTMVTERFSNIGSTPVIKPENVYQVVGDAINYLRPRISNKVSIELNSHAENIHAQMNRSLFEWVIENVCKNAVDAMKGQGAIRINIVKESEQFVFVDISDTGKGIEKKMLSKVFNPGFTTRKRGWGLGLTLAKRIMEGYHNGRIFVNTSELGKGTTFRIVLHGVKELDE
ncbi:sensor histidine kinase [Cyclobacterium amurskyense]|uniref:histidine kinase n=1 Tax=Cyclobacterium amurskyense TaxID=320787 RepID=A0A0H4P8B3_9BACT|nr:ATP-binding protein [Cyclobacterium amurskyense]AKP50419.1 Integral membrane sensor signal transduction histidine kinase [Cyclobacterium amurskyense]|tara:strand:+ start:15016 stop:16218 length:1203 start_codon:yes stop_codon:yes gene_type:complete